MNVNIHKGLTIWCILITFQADPARPGRALVSMDVAHDPLP
jgi:hypothetical protein